jgi:hypothetical protein
MNVATVTEPSKADIELLAYRLWIESGRVRGRDREHWQTAREILRRKPARMPHAAVPAGIQFPAPILGPTVPPFTR